MTTIAERVAAGAAFLDEHEPGWADRVNLKRLYIGSTCNCMLGQLRGEYLPGVRWMRPKAQPACCTSCAATPRRSCTSSSSMPQRT